MKSRKSRIIITIIVIVVLIGGAAALIKKKKAKLARAPKYGLAPTVVHVATAKHGNLDINLSYLSVVEPFNTANVSSRDAASVVTVAVDEGDMVKAGDIMLELDAKDILENIASLSAQVKQAEAELAANQATVAALEKSTAYWEREAKRDNTLAKDGAIPEAQAEGTANKADEISGQHDAARRKSTALSETIRSIKRKKAQLQAQLDYYKLQSPFDGVVTRRLVDPGDLASPGKPLITVEDRSRLMLAFDVPQQDLDRIHEGLPVAFTIAGKSLQAKLSHLYPALTAARMVRAEVYIDGPDRTGVTIGAYVPVIVRLSQFTNVTLVPADCLVNNQGKKPYVYVVKNGHVTVRPVTVLGDNGKLNAIEGVKAGEQAVINTFLGWANLAQGMPVEVTK